jgi:uncharacterized protein YndB with AHSA1/START domain
MIKKTLLFLGVILSLILGVAAFQPNEFKVERSLVIPAPAQKIFPLVNDFHFWAEWSPWSKMDPNMKVNFQGPSSGVGAHYAWSGNKDVGEGSMTIRDSQPNSLIQFDLDFKVPMEAHHQTVFTFQTENAGTKVTWIMTGNVNYVGKVLHLFMNMDKMVGESFEKGLNDLKAIAEKS